MKESVKEWILPVAILLVIVVAYVYYHYPKEAQQVTQQFEDKPYISYRDNKLYIDEFNSNDYEEWKVLNTKIYNKLKGNTGNVEVFFLHKETDKYGNSTSQYNSIGYLNIDELNKYTSVEYWIKDGGVEKSLKTKADNPNQSPTTISTDTAVLESGVVESQPTRNVDSTFVYYDFNKMAYKPWSYYSRDGKSLTLISPTDPTINYAINYWETFISDIQDVKISCSEHYADVTITTPKGETLYTLNLKVKYTYALSGNPSMALEINPDHCELFFIKGSNCVSVDSKSLDPIK